MLALTHDGVFHADDCFAGAVLRMYDPTVEIVRSRGIQVMADIVFDVGGGTYDHHQRGGNGARPNGIPYAAFGLIWRDYGAIICGDNTALAAEVDRTLVQAIDAHDNGFPLVTAYALPGVFPATIAHAINSFNPSWDEDQDFDAGYEAAVAWALPVLQRAIARARGTLEAEGVIVEAVLAAADPRIIVLDRYVPWQEALIAQSASALYIVYPSAGTWRCQVVPVAAGQPGARKPLPAAWGGLDGPALAALTGVADATFAHRALFICGAVSKEGAVALAQLAREDA